jgi:Ser-tRNA(Ala) deacylase AlaX
MAEPTELIHLTYEGNFCLECESTVIAIDRIKNKETSSSPSQYTVILDKTAMHPQGGGQPTDIGVINSTSTTEGGTRLKVDKVTIDRETGIVTHAGTLVSVDGDDDEPANAATFEIGSKVQVSVDADTRRLLSECHTAGHVVDSAMARCGQNLPPTKGYHFLDGPYVEYRGKIPPEERETLLENLQAAFRDLVQEDVDTTIQTLPKEKANKVCNNIAQNFDLSDYPGETVRVVSVANYPCPCGGTHVKSTGDLKDRGWGVKGPIKSKKGVVRIRYGPDCA